MLVLFGDWAPGSRSVIWDVAPPAPVSTPSQWRPVVNIEGPILASEDQRERPKAGPALQNRTPLELGELEPGVAVLANNHSMDFGVAGLRETLATLAEKGWATAGAGLNLGQARTPARVGPAKSTEIVVINCCEAQFGGAGHDHPGVAETGPWVVQTVLKLRRDRPNAAILVSCHSGAEMSPWPSPLRQAEYRLWIDAGADIVHGHHSHVPQGFETTEDGGLILYGLGNTVVDLAKWRQRPHTDWSLSAWIAQPKKPVDFTIHPLRISEEDGATGPLRIYNATDDYQTNYRESCQEPLRNAEQLEGLWQQHSLHLYEQYFRRWLGEFPPGDWVGRLKSSIRSVASIFRSGAATRDQDLLRYHLWACESHRDAITTALGLRSGEIRDKRHLTPQSLLDTASKP